MHEYRAALNAHIRKLEIQLLKAIRAKEPCESIRAEIVRSKRELDLETADA